jgi:nicotinamidase-related amidase
MQQEKRMELVLAPKTTALVLIDLQHSAVARQLAPRTSSEVLKNSVLLANALREKGSTIIFVRVLITEIFTLPVDSPTPRGNAAPPPNASDLVPETGVQPCDLVVTKRQWGAFYGTDLDQQLRRRNIRTIVLGGIATNFGVESTARAAFDRNYELVFAENAMSSLSAEGHAFTVNNIFPRMGLVRSADQIVEALR